VVGELPKTPSSKVQKYLLRQAGVTAATWDREKAGYRLQEEIRRARAKEDGRREARDAG
jgi:hypothetical protein